MRVFFSFSIDDFDFALLMLESIVFFFFSFGCSNALRRIRSKKGEQQSQACSGTTQKLTNPKSHSRSKKCIETVADERVADNLNLPLPLPPRILESVTINNDHIDQRRVYTSTMNGGTPSSKEKNIASL